MNKLIPSVNSDRSRSKSPMNKRNSVSREESVASKASSIISTAATAGTDRQTPLNDFDKDDVSDTENDSSVSKGTFKKTTDENEVKR